MTPTLFTAECSNRLYVSASLGDKSVYAVSPALVDQTTTLNVFKLGATTGLKFVGARNLNLAHQTRTAPVGRPSGSHCVWLCASEINAGPSTGAVLVAAVILPAQDPDAHPPVPDARWIILAMHNGVVFTPIPT